MKTLVVCSGGLDSVTLAHKIHADKTRTLTRLLSFDYGQRHKKELTFAAKCAKDLDVPHHIIDISGVGSVLTGSALTDDVNVPDGHYQKDTMKITIVPNRNAIMLTVAYGIASAKDDESVATAVHGGDHFIYPDCRPAFIQSFAAMQNHALEGVSEIELYTPYLTHDKSAIAKDAHAFNVTDTWSCYKGGDLHCGRCGTCVERREAYTLANVEDPTQYDDPDYWREAIKAHEAQKSGAV